VSNSRLDPPCPSQPIVVLSRAGGRTLEAPQRHHVRSPFRALLVWWPLPEAADPPDATATVWSSGEGSPSAIDTSTAHGAACDAALKSLHDFVATLKPRAETADAGANRAAKTRALLRGPRQPWAPIDTSRWQSAFTSYHQLITADRVRPLASPPSVAFAGYFNRMHGRIHRLFEDGFPASLESRPAADPLNDPNLNARLEIVLDKTGKLIAIGVVRSSFVQTFDLSALEAVVRAQPFDVPPTEILSADGNVYMQWIFYRDERCGCATFNARPAILFGPPRSSED
jgi:TonB family protein